MIEGVIFGLSLFPWEDEANASQSPLSYSPGSGPWPKLARSELIEEYLERHQETLEILSRPDWIDAIQQGLKASEKGEIVKWRKKTSGK